MPLGMWGLVVRVLIFDILASFTVAMMEIQIEGASGWAKHLPTHKFHNWLTRMIWGSQGITGYHLWLASTVLVFIHLPFFVFPKLWSPSLEAFTLASFLFAVVLEDFFWFILNPAFRLKKFNKQNVTWFDHWFGPVPLFYIRLLLVAMLLFWIFVTFNTQTF